MKMKKTGSVEGQPGFPASGLAAVGLSGGWIAMAAAETLLRDGQDALDDVSMINENYAVIAGAGLLHWAAGMLLIVGLAGSAPLIWASRIGRVGWGLTVTLAAGLGAFAMVHLLALETASAGLDGRAMNLFLSERLGEGFGPWVIPVLFVGLVGPWSVVLLLVGLVRVHRVRWASPALFVCGAAIHMIVPGEFFETASHWVMSGGMVLAAHGILQARTRLDEGVTSAVLPSLAR